MLLLEFLHTSLNEIMTTMRERHASMPPTITEAPAARERSFSAKLSVAAAERWKLVRQRSAYILFYRYE